MPEIVADDLNSGDLDQTRPDRRLLLVLLIVPVLLSLAAVWALDHTRANKSLFSITNLVGPTTRSLLAGDGITVCTEEMGTRGNPICFHAARMPATAVVVASGIRLLGDRYLPVVCFKTILLLLPVEFAIYLAWCCLPQPPGRRAVAILLLLVPFLIPAFLADVTNLQVDEGFSYSFLALATAILFLNRAAVGSTRRTSLRGIGKALLFAVALDGLYLSKSGMLLAVLVLLVGFLALEKQTRLRWLVLLLVAAAPLGWALHQHHASGRYSVGTSFDGINLHKGNNAGFLQNYPPVHGDSLDWYDFELNRGVSFPDEWSFNDYHRRAALEYLRTHPRETLSGDLRKLKILFFSFEKYGSTANSGARRLIEIAGMLTFRLIFWTATASAVFLLLRHCLPADRSLRVAAATFLALVAASTLPYLAGFAYTRHVSILIYPSALFCCRLLCEPERD
ncbi:hypothetical protein [Tunturibacter empetritectus]|uniref:Glycosyltransferase RgtA/B/C/D-like domain-containing protein n=1 Tax=Tunturiibacter empetritectus TaxID=3069691 RepID=A0A7W8IKP8_9BACT|nr:hypothetical protein [Edaphobacter lichenicola]MBB5318961.1 hypothetical protein [Edaphobacter lichenicola]